MRLAATIRDVERAIGDGERARKPDLFNKVLFPVIMSDERDVFA